MSKVKRLYTELQELNTDHTSLNTRTKTNKHNKEVDKINKKHNLQTPYSNKGK